jgi:NAD(P)-dependent dehydrogenase (short-subunit alcohol dehydrogenase family)
VGHTIGTSKGRLFASTTDFIPPVPPSSKGTPVFSDIDFQGISPESQRRNADPSAVYVVSGSSRGIGLQFVKALVDRTKGSIVACCRNPSTATGLNDYIQRLSPSDQARIHKISLDLEKQESIEQATAAIKDKFNRVDLLLNVAGLLGDASTTPGPERSLSKLDRAWVEKTMAVNLIGPIMLSKALAPFMKTKRKEDQTTSIIASLSARVGSISDNELGGWYSYRLSKAALNQATRTMSHELKRQGTWTIALHPGTTDTDLSKPFQKNVADDRLFPVEFTVNQLLEVIDSMNAEHSGGLYDWAGKALPF